MHSKQEPWPESQARQGTKRTKEEMENAELLQINANLRRKLEEVENDEPFLNRAIRNRDWNRVMEIINSGAHVNVNDATGMTPLHLAAREIEPKVVQLLLDEGECQRAHLFNEESRRLLRTW